MEPDYSRVPQSSANLPVDHALARAQLERQVQLVRQFEGSGQVEGLPCPSCNTSSISVWFTHPCKGEYRTWFVCDRCGFDVRLQHGAKPTRFDERRISRHLEEYDVRLLEKRVL